ncbi:hypothetical protein NLJ89_g6097 [Agrocybe chaxingu]|uniref:Autophagy-related protein 13 n=1 Tax=Agrocybe chaxingu TaxID=84603 RepID=A0A9W8MT08_9AGAR|nr:hypothetical protein NLJ89_g6097 [Agrocybe chaxingu]
METPDSDLFTKEAREPYRYVSQAAPPGPPSFDVQVLLAIPELTNNQVLVYMSPDSSRVRIEPTPAFVLLEQWTLQFTPTGAGQGAHANVHTDVALPIIYKHGIVLFRSIFSLLRILPAWKFFKRLKRSRNGNLAIRLRVKPLVNVDDAGILGFGASPSPTHAQPLSTSSYTFPVIPHLSGTLALSATYLDTPNFQLDELESLLSSRFISLDLEGFVPTLDKNRQRDSVSGSSLPASKSSLSRSPPRPIGRVTSGGPAAPLDSTSIAEKFILPARVPAPASLGTSASTGSSALIPPPRPFPTTTAQPTPTSGLAITRIRKESLNSSSSSSISTREPPFQVPGTSSLSSSAASGPLPIRRPNINPAFQVLELEGRL